MDNNVASGIESLSKSILSLDFTLKSLLVFVIVLAAAVFAFVFLQSLYKNLLLARAGGTTKKLPIVLVSIAEAFGKIGGNALVLVPILAGIVAVFGIAIGATRAISSVNDFIEREQQIKALSIAVNYLNQSDKVLDVRITSVQDGVTTMRLDYRASDPQDSSVPPAEWTKTLSIAGTEIHFDSAVFNFSYSEVGAGRQRNIAIPYRIFSNSVAAASGTHFFEDTSFVPEEDDYGFIPAVYRDQLMRLLADPRYAGEMGIRSVNGSDVWRADVKAGDRFRIRVEQTGGLSLEVR